MFRRYLPTNSFARNVVVLTSGTAAGQLIIILGTPILTRLYSPAQFGVLSVFAALLGIISVISGLRYELAIPIPRSRERAANVLALSLLCVGGVAVVTAFVVASAGTRLADLLGVLELAQHFWLLPVGVALSGAYQAFMYWATRVGSFKNIAQTKVQQGGAMIAIQAGLGVLHPTTLGLLAGSVAGQFVGLLNLVRIFRRQPGSKTLLERANLIAVAKRYRAFPMFTSLAGLTNTAGHSLPPLVLASLFNPAAAGLYMIAQRLGSQPLTLVGRSVGQVFFSDAATARREGTLGSLTLYAFRSLLVIGVLPISLLAYVAPDLFSLIFGPAWSEAGTYLQLLSPWLIAQFVVSPLGTMFVVVERQGLALVLQAILLVVRIAALVMGAYYGDVLLALALFGASSAMIFVIFGAVAVSFSGASVPIARRMLLREMLLSCAILVAIEAVSRSVPQLFQEVPVEIVRYSLVAAAGLLALWRIRSDLWISRSGRKGAAA